MNLEQIRYMAHAFSEEGGESYITCLSALLRKYMPQTEFTLAEIGFLLRITRERVRQLEQAANNKLSHPRLGRKLKQYFTHESDHTTRYYDDTISASTEYLG